MRNLAGSVLADDYCELELRRADINVVLGDYSKGEVRTKVTGTIGPFTFRRAWYYWMVEGPMPMVAAIEMYRDPAGARDVRVDGALYENASYSHSSRHGRMTHAHGEENLFG